MTAPTFFPTAADFRRWLKANHETAPELLVGFWKKGTRQALDRLARGARRGACFGWIDGIRKSLGAESYTIRFTPAAQGQHLEQGQRRPLRRR